MTLPYYCTNCYAVMVNGICPDCSQHPTTTSGTTNDLQVVASKPPAPPVGEWTPKVGDWFILKASYCHGDTPGCTDDRPCAKCLKECNRFVIGGMHQLTAGNVYFFAPTLCSRDGDGYMESTNCSVLTDNEQALKDHGPYANRISEAMPIENPDLATLTRQRDGLVKALTCILPTLKDMTYKHDGANEVAWNDIRLAEAALAAAKETNERPV